MKKWFLPQEFRTPAPVIRIREPEEKMPRQEAEAALANIKCPHCGRFYLEVKR